MILFALLCQKVRSREKTIWNMKRNYSNKPHELIGVKVVGKEKVAQYAGKYAGKEYYRLFITCETHPEIKKVCVFDDYVGSLGEVGAVEIMNIIEKSDYADKRYLFYCRRRDNK